MIDQPDLRHSIAVAKRLIDLLGMSFPISGQETVVGVSVGIAMARSTVPSGLSESADDILRHADVAMYTAKAAGKRRFAVFDPAMHASIVARHELSAELARSVAHEELVVHYQPIVALDSGETVGVEALVRWRHPVRGLTHPDEFIGLAEENGTILALGRWVLAEACRTLVALRAAGGPERLMLSVNVSPLQLQRPDIVDEIEAVLAETGFDPADLVLELTETAMFRDTVTTIARLQAIRALGVRIAVDDFGTGYSSLGYLRRFPVDILKIARDFVVSGDSRPGSLGLRPRDRGDGPDARTAGSSPRGSRSRPSSTGCATSAASSGRASCSPARSRPNTSAACSAPASRGRQTPSR